MTHDDRLRNVVLHVQAAKTGTIETTSRTEYARPVAQLSTAAWDE